MQRYRIAPPYSHRVSLEEQMRAYPSAQEAFESGDYLLAAQRAEEGSELKSCASILAGFVEKGVRTLESLGQISPRGRIYLAYGYWCQGRSAEALKELSLVTKGAEQTLGNRLRELVESPQIPVLVIAAHVPVFAGASDDLRQASHRCGQFVIKHVCTQLERNAYDCNLTDRFDEFLRSLPESERPRFIYSGTPEWMPPLGIENVSIPKIVLLHDTDFFLYRAYENYFKADISLVCTSQEHYELTRGLGIRSVSNMFSDAFQAMPTPPQRCSTDRPIDVLFTGAAVETLTPEKSRFMFQLSTLGDEYDVRIYDGHLDREAYRKLLALAKFLPIVNRYRGQSSPRWRDALSEGTFVLTPEGVPYGEICRGFFPFREDSIAADLRRHLKAYADQSDQSPYSLAKLDAELNELFPNADTSLKQPLERNLKFCALMALEFEEQRRPPPVSRSTQRWCWLVPQIDCHIYGVDNILGKTALLADDIKLSQCRVPAQYSDFASLYLQRTVVRHDQTAAHDRDLEKALQIIDQGLKTHPTSLLLLFNRAHWNFHFSQPPRQKAEELFQEIVQRMDNLAFDPLGSDIGLGYAGLTRDEVFPYYEYGQMIVTMTTMSKQRLALEEADIRKAKQLLASCAHAYIGLARLDQADSQGALDSFRRALAVYPDNPKVAKLLLTTVLGAWASKDFRDDNLAKECVELFYTVANWDPGILLKYVVFDIMEALQALGWSEQLTELLDDWYRFRRTVISSQPPDAYEEIRQLARLFKFGDFFPKTLVARTASWGAAGNAPQPSDGFGTKLFLSMCLFNFEQTLQQQGLNLAELVLGQSPRDLHEKIAELNSQLEAIRRSNSWRLTAPLRYLRKVRTPVERKV